MTLFKPILTPNVLMVSVKKLFGLKTSEIAEMEGVDKKSSSVRQLIIRTSDQLQAGEISLIETTPERSKAAKKRLDTHRKKRRERAAKNKYLENAKRRSLFSSPY